MSEPDNPHWLRDVSDELRAEEAVRPMWRARLLDEIARSPQPRRGGPDGRELSDDAVEFDDRVPTCTATISRHERRLVLHPLAGVAAALLFMALGAGGTIAVMSSRGRAAADSSSAVADPGAAGPIGATTHPTSATSDESLVRFELSAPTAARVALVGSFNQWDPVATPLERDAATGTWRVSLRLPAGRHVYAFVVDGDVTADPAAPRTADADFGTPNSVVLVSGRSS